MKTKDITLTGLMAALIFIGTFFFKNSFAVRI